MNPKDIICEAIEKYQPVAIALLFSGGHDSLVSSFVSAKILTDLGLDFVVYHGDTTIGIPETQQYVKHISKSLGRLFIRKPPNRHDWYDYIVATCGFPGPTKASHQFMYRRLKERALQHFVTHECKSRPYARENVLLLSGARQQESKIRMGYSEPTRKNYSQIWCNPIFYWSEDECIFYIKHNKLPKNSVKEKLCISGECLCGAFAGKEEPAEIKHYYPDVYDKIDNLHQVAIHNGFPWGWSSGPGEWKKEEAKKSQLNMFMCVGCESRHNYQ